MGITAHQIINQAASKIGVKGRGKDLAPDELMDWLTGLHQMLDGWALEKLTIPVVTRETFTLSQQQSFTIGPGGDFDTSRPVEIKTLEIIDAAGESYTVPCVPLGSYVRTTEDVVARPRRAYFDDAYPLATLYFDRIPYDPTLRIWSRKPITAWQIEDVDITENPSFAGQTIPVSSLTVETLQADIEFEPGYEAAIIFNLAVYMAPDYEKEPTRLVISLAERYKSRLKNHNLEVPQLTVDEGMLNGEGYYDIVEGPG